MPSAAWPEDQSKTIELTCLTRVAQDARRFVALGAIELARLTRVVQEARCFMALGAILGN